MAVTMEVRLQAKINISIKPLMSMRESAGNIYEKKLTLGEEIGRDEDPG